MTIWSTEVIWPLSLMPNCRRCSRLRRNKTVRSAHRVDTRQAQRSGKSCVGGQISHRRLELAEQRRSGRRRIVRAVWARRRTVRARRIADGKGTCWTAEGATRVFNRIHSGCGAKESQVHLRILFGNDIRTVQFGTGDSRCSYWDPGEKSRGYCGSDAIRWGHDILLVTVGCDVQVCTSRVPNAARNPSGCMCDAVRQRLGAQAGKRAKKGINDA